MGFSHVQGNVGTAGAGSSSVSVVLTSTPTAGSTVCVGVTLNPTSVTNITVKDGNNNTYTVTPGSPSLSVGTIVVYLAYLTNAPTNAHATITATFVGGTSDAQMWGEEFSTSGVTASFDKDARVASTPPNGGTVNIPTITPKKAGELLYSTAAPQNTITAPAADATLGVWTGAHGGIVNGNQSEYVLSSGTGAIAVNYTINVSTGSWTAMAMAFTLDVPVLGWKSSTAGPSRAI